MGAASSAFALAYAASKIPGGVAADSVSPPRLLAGSLLASACINLALSVQTSALPMILLWGLNG